MGPYWWPDPSKPDGLPYIRRDGHVNPEARGGVMDDSQRIKNLSSSVKTLSQRPWSEAIGGHVRELLLTFFVWEETCMNPSLTYGQSIPGRCAGRGIGIIDTVPLVSLLDSLAELEAHGPIFRDGERAQLQAWFSAYLDWLLTDPLGCDERNALNNHGTWMDAQLCAYAIFAERPGVAISVLTEVPSRRLEVQLAPDGSFPLELERTRPFLYTVYNVRAFLRLASFGKAYEMDLYRRKTSSGASLELACSQLKRIAEEPALWTRPELDSRTGLPGPLQETDIQQLNALLEMASVL